MAKKLSNKKWNPLWWLSRLFHGQVLSIDFFARNWLLVLICLVFVVTYISNKYNCQRSMEQVKELEQQLEVARTEAIRVRSDYMSKITERSMKARVDSLHLNLTVQEQPPFLIK